MPVSNNEELNNWLEQKTDPWISDWNNIIRNVIFKDSILKSLMKVPDDIGVIEFTDRYFIRANFTTKILFNESVRIIFGVIPYFSNDPNVTSNRISFDIYVKEEDSHNVGRDRLVLRSHLIAKRLIELLTKDRYCGVYRFFSPSEHDIGTSVIGYTRYNVSLSFMKTY